MTPDKLQRNNGQVMVEAMLAITIAVIGLLGIFSLVSRSLSLNRVVLDRYIGTYLAAEGIEIVKNMIDANVIQAKPWNVDLASGSYEVDYNDSTLQPGSNRFISHDSASGFYSYDSGKPTRFKRSVTIEYPGAGAGEKMKVNSVVKWTTRGGGNFEVNLEDHFFNWR